MKILPLLATFSFTINLEDEKDEEEDDKIGSRLTTSIIWMIRWVKIFLRMIIIITP